MAQSQSESRTTDHVPEWKREEVADLVDLAESYDSVGVVGVTGIPSRQLQEMRHGLHGSAVLRMSRNSLVVRALEEVDEGVEALVDDVAGQVGLIVTDDNPFALYRKLEETKTPAPINAGEVAPNDIVIPEGDTGIDPGPFVGELQQVGADARIEDGSIKVLSDSTVASAGEEATQQLSSVLSELGIEPKEVGLDLRAVFADGVLFEPDELALDIDAYRADIRAAAGRARNLSVGAAYPTAQTAGALLAKASGEAKSVGLFAAIESPDLADDLVARADARVRALAAAIDDEEALPEELRDVAEAPADAGEESDEESTDDEPASGADEEADDSDSDPDSDEDEDDEGDGGDALGAMFD